MPGMSNPASSTMIGAMRLAGITLTILPAWTLFK
jgi:hypothetical protein